MKQRTRMFMAVMVLAGLFITAGAQAAQSFLIVNNSGCIQYIGIKNSNSRTCVNKALAVNADATLNKLKGSGISYITAGPTKAIDACCYKSKVKATVSLSGENWRIDIDPGGIRVIDRDTYQVVFNAPGEFSKCVSGAMGSIMGTEGASSPRVE